MKIGGKQFPIGEHAYVMGILNVTPDSFSDGGKWSTLDAALFHAEQMVSEGAAILDIGGESTRPGYTKISDAEEIERVVPVIEAVKARLDVPISVDTYKSAVAAAAVRAGADLINDIWGLQADPNMASLIAESGTACCLMHNRKEAVYTDFLTEVLSDLQLSLTKAKAAGIADDKIIIDPGIGFAKSLAQNLQLMHHLEILHDLHYPILLGTSRKSMIGLTLDLPKDEREEGTLATTVLGVTKGCSFIRVHDVLKNVRAIQMTEAILRA